MIGPGAPNNEQTLATVFVLLAGVRLSPGLHWGAAGWSATPDPAG
jgi:hypothetical protein